MVAVRSLIWEEAEGECGLKRYELGLYEKAMPGDLTWREKMLCAKETGFDYIEMSIDETDAKLARLEMPSAERVELLGLMSETGVPIRSMCLSGHRKYPLGSHDPEIRSRGMTIMQGAIDLAADLGIRMIQLAGYDVYYEKSDEDTQQRFKENLKIAAEMAAAAGVMMGFETMETEFMNTVEKSMKYVSVVDSPFLNVYPDIGNITNAANTYGTDALDDLQCGYGHLIALHLKETVPGIFREVPFGTGQVNFRAAIEKAWQLGVRRFVTEMWYTGNKTWKEDIVFANQLMSNILNRQV